MEEKILLSIGNVEERFAGMRGDNFEGKESWRELLWKVLKVDLSGEGVKFIK